MLRRYLLRMLAVSPAIYCMDLFMFATEGKLTPADALNFFFLNAAVFLGFNLPGAVVIFRPVARYFAGGGAGPLPRALERLPLRSACWIAVLGSVYGLFSLTWVVMTSSEPLPWPAVAPLVTGILYGYVLFPATVYYFLVNDHALGLRLEAFRRYGTVAATGTGRLWRKLLGAFAVLAVMPLLQILLDTVAAARLPAGKTLFMMSVDRMAAIDASYTAVGVTAVVFFVARWFAHPVRILMRSMERVRAGDLSVMAPLVSDDEFGAITADFNDMVRGLREREEIRNTFGCYVTRDVAALILGDRRRSLDGELRTATVLATDIEGYTALAEGRDPRAVVAFLNEYFTHLVGIVEKHRGIVNKYIGDAILALFNVPVDDPWHAHHALEAAREILDLTAARTFGDLRLPTRIGINTGPVLAGSIGSRDRLEYTVIGDTVNVAARLESLNKEYGSYLLIGEATRELVHRDYPLVHRGEITLRGKRDPMNVYGLPPAGGER